MLPDELLSPKQRRIQRTAQGAFWGLAMGGLMLCVGLVGAVIAVAKGRPVAFDIQRDLPLAALYAAAFSVAGAVIGLLAPMRRTKIGAYALGFIGAGIVSAII